MIALLQRVSQAKVEIDGVKVGSCGHGLMILLGVINGDDENDALLLAEKISKLRIFSDDEGKMNLSVNDIGGSALVISQFTLGANYKKGNRPDYLNSAPPAISEPLYEKFISLLDERIGGSVEHGQFGADMQVTLTNDGPVTIIMDSAVLKK